MARLSTVQREALPAEQRRFYDGVRAIRGRPVSGPFIVTMNSSPDLAARFAHLGHYFHARGQADESIVPIRVRAFVSLIGSRALEAPYEWAAWVNWALEAGVPQDTVDAIREGRAPASLTAEESLVSDVCSQLVSGNHRVSEGTYRAALDHFGAQGLVELVMTLGYFAMIALPLNAFEIEMSPEQNRMRKPYAPLTVRGAPWSEAAGERAGMPALAGRAAGEPRVPLLSRHEDLAPEHRHFLDRIVRTRGWISGAFQVLLHAPDLAERVANVGEFILYETILPPAIATLAWLITARDLDCDYAWAAGVDAARAAGVEETLIGALEKGTRPPSLGREQKALFDFCQQLLRGNHHVSESSYRAAIDVFGIPAAVQVAATVGYVTMMAVLVNAFDVPPAADASRPAL